MPGHAAALREFCRARFVPLQMHCVACDHTRHCAPRPPLADLHRPAGHGGLPHGRRSHGEDPVGGAVRGRGWGCVWAGWGLCRVAGASRALSRPPRTFAQLTLTRTHQPALLAPFHLPGPGCRSCRLPRWAPAAGAGGRSGRARRRRRRRVTGGATWVATRNTTRRSPRTRAACCVWSARPRRRGGGRQRARQGQRQRQGRRARARRRRRGRARRWRL